MSDSHYMNSLHSPPLHVHINCLSYSLVERTWKISYFYRYKKFKAGQHCKLIYRQGHDMIATKFVCSLSNSQLKATALHQAW